LGALLEAWWRQAGEREGVVVVGRLRLGRPSPGRTAGWSIPGAIGRSLGRGSVPVDVELWPFHEEWTRVTMTPQRRVLASDRYFRTGHRALGRFLADLARLEAATEVRGPRSSNSVP